MWTYMPDVHLPAAVEHQHEDNGDRVHGGVSNEGRGLHGEGGHKERNGAHHKGRHERARAAQASTHIHVHSTVHNS